GEPGLELAALTVHGLAQVPASGFLHTEVVAVGQLGHRDALAVRAVVADPAPQLGRALQVVPDLDLDRGIGPAGRVTEIGGRVRLEPLDRLLPNGLLHTLAAFPNARGQLVGAAHLRQVTRLLAAPTRLEVVLIGLRERR